MTTHTGRSRAHPDTLGQTPLGQTPLSQAPLAQAPLGPAPLAPGRTGPMGQQRPLGLWRGLTGRMARRASVPAPPLHRGERALAREAPGEPHSHVVATTHALHICGADGEWRRLAWEETVRVSWDPRRGLLHVTALRTDPVFMTLPPGSRLGAFVRDRVAATLLGTRRTAAAGVRITVVARRRAGTSEPVWHVHLSEGADAHEPQVAAAVAETIRRMCAEIGLH